MNKKRIAIVGGGISGLSAAYQLARDAQSEFTLFEASPRLGGIVETVRQDGFVIECGPDSWVTEKPWARELSIELGLESEVIPSNDRQRRTWLRQRDQLIPMPDGMRMMVPTQLSAIDASPLFTPEARLAFHRELERAGELKASALTEGEDESVADFVRRHFGDEVARTLAAPLLSGVFGGDIENLSARAVLPAFVQMEREHGSLIAALQSRPAAAENSIFTTLRSGLGTLIERMAATLPTASVRLSEPVLNAARVQRGWRLRLKHSEETYDAVILATPAHITRALLRSLNPEFVPLLTIESTSAIVAAFAFAPEQTRSLNIPSGFGYLVPQSPNPNPQLLACTFVHQKFPHRVPEGGALLRAFFGSETAANLLNESDDTLAALALKQLTETLGPLPAPHVTVVRRWPLSLPQYAVGHVDRVAQLESLAARFPGLRIIGNAYHGVGLPDMVRMGREAGRSFQKPPQNV